MGIKNLNPFLKEKCPEAFKELPYSFFKGKRVGVDSNNVLMKLMSRAHKEIVDQTDVCHEEPDRKKIVERWLDHLKDEIVKFLKYGITLNFIFDGAYIDEKSETQLKRREEKQKRITEAEELKKKIFKLDELERTPKHVTELRKKMHHLGYISSEDKKLVETILKNLGFPVLHATEEGEKLCAMLCIEGKIDAVYSRDTDVLAMGCPLMFGEEAGWLHNPISGKMELSVKCSIFKPILSALEMEYLTFLDLCIMSGCDFNSNIPRIGVKKSYNLLKNHKSIDFLPTQYDKDILNHVKCREIFKRQKSDDICQSDINLNLNTDALKNNLDFFKENNIEHWLEELKYLYQNCPTPSDIFIEKTPSYSSSVIKLNILNKKESIPKQKASPKKMSMKTVQSLNNRQIEKYKEREEKKIIKLKILPS
jgi:flap endonuclease-1